MLTLMDVPRTVTTLIMGYVNYATTDKYYTRITKGERRWAVAQLSDLASELSGLWMAGTTGRDDAPVVRHTVRRVRESQVAYDDEAQTTPAFDGDEGHLLCSGAGYEKTYGDCSSIG